MPKFDPQNCPVGEIPEPPYFYPATAETAEPDEDPFASAAWAEHSAALASSLASPPPRLSARSLARTFMHGHRALGSEHAGLYRAVKRLLKSRERVRLLDFGGGCGENYIALVRALGRDGNRLDHLVIENEQNCSLGRITFPAASFAPDIPDEHFDIAAIIGTLQYIPDWVGLLATLKSRCDQILIARTPLRVDGQSFAIRQAVCPHLGRSAGRKAGTASVTVIGLDELKNAMRDWDVTEDRLVSDYSSHLSRFPAEDRNVVYRSMAWARHGNASKLDR